MRLLLNFETSRIKRGSSPAIGLFICLLFCVVPSCIAQEDVIELKASQNMIITGKGPGQDGAINPYLDRESTAVVENIGENPFEVRIQSQGKILEIREVFPGKREEFSLQKGVELYLDTELPGTARVNFKPVDESP